MKTITREHRTHDAAPPPPRWTKEQIRAARTVAIAPFLEKRGLHLAENGGGNYNMREYPGLIIKDSYWRWPELNISGNTIDLCMQVLRLSFNETMLALSQTNDDTQRDAGPKAS
ncbi:MAG: hypothetical protein LBI02_00535 [Opitutaceae bacterium]|jgi:hypothetical protein|nr:hypothetical protein [Opitutaceae bacterium]